MKLEDSFTVHVGRCFPSDRFIALVLIRQDFLVLRRRLIYSAHVCAPADFKEAFFDPRSVVKLKRDGY